MGWSVDYEDAHVMFDFEIESRSAIENNCSHVTVVHSYR